MTQKACTCQARCGMTRSMLKPSMFYKAIETIEADAYTHETRANALLDWARAMLAHGQKLRNDADSHGLPPDAQGQLDAFRAMLDEGPPDGDGYTVTKEADAEAAPKRRTRRTKAQIAADNAAQETGEPAHCGACGWSGRTDLPLETFPPQGTCPKCGGGVVGDEPPGKGGSVLKADDQERIALAGRIRSLDGWDKMLPSHIAVKLGVPLQAVRDAWPLLTGEKAQ